MEVPLHLTKIVKARLLLTARQVSPRGAVPRPRRHPLGTPFDGRPDGGRQTRHKEAPVGH